MLQRLLEQLRRHQDQEVLQEEEELVLLLLHRICHHLMSLRDIIMVNRHRIFYIHCTIVNNIQPHGKMPYRT